MIIIAGATGYIGKYLSVELTKKGREVLALGRNLKSAEFLRSQGVPFMEFDLLNDADYDKLPTENVEAIVNLAVCLPEHEAPLEAFFDVNMTGNYKLLEFARKNGIKRFIMASSHKVYWDISRDTPITEDDLPCFIGPHSPYIISKIAAESFLQWYSKDYGMDCIVLRLTGVHGFGALMGFLENDGSYTRTAIEVFIEKAVKGEPIEVWGDTSIKRDHVYIKDVLGAIEASVDAPAGTKGIYNVASGVAHSQVEDATAVAKAFATDKGVSKIVLRPDKPSLRRGYVYSIEKLKRDMGWTPKFADPDVLFADYRKEWEQHLYKSHHFIKPEDRPLSFG
jgi:UDP-glucose 4-epimerase